jgi:hypothetical protein
LTDTQQFFLGTPMEPKELNQPIQFTPDTGKEKQKAHIFAVARHLRLIAISDSLNPERKTLAC